MSQSTWEPAQIEAAAAAIREADGLLIGAGAGMGVDSGLPDFRGNSGFWRAYPPMSKLGLSFADMANPRWFQSKPRLAWGFYGHRLHLYRDTVPHGGFSLLRKWSQGMAHGAFVYTSNVDGQFQRAGFSEEQIVECHGSIHHFQCTASCRGDIWSAGGTDVTIDEGTFLADEPLPQCAHCTLLARPNILMFGDMEWLSDRVAEQDHRYAVWQDRCEGSKVVAIECGAGTAIPSVRWACERFVNGQDGTLIRINPREPKAPSGAISFAAGALEVLEAIDEAL